MADSQDCASTVNQEAIGIKLKNSEFFPMRQAVFFLALLFNSSAVLHADPSTDQSVPFFSESSVDGQELISDMLKGKMVIIFVDHAQFQNIKEILLACTIPSS